MDNPEKTEGATENGQSRENRKGNQEQPRLDNPESNWQHGVHKTKYEDKQNKNTPQKAKNMSNTDSTIFFSFQRYVISHATMGENVLDTTNASANEATRGKIVQNVCISFMS
jgi:hypothetical protein